jgi:SdpC family antimicrobial peptide
MISLVRRNRTTYRSCATLLALTQVIWIFGSGCSTLTEPTSPELTSARVISGSPNRTGQGPADGEALYRGIFFGQGSILQQIPELDEVLSWRASANQTSLNTVDAMVNDIVPVIASNHSGYFAHFSTEMRSGDQVRIFDALREASTFTTDAMGSLPTYQSWLSMTPSQKEAAQDQMLQAYNAGQMSQSDYDYVTAMLMIDGGDEEVKFKLWVGWALVLAGAVGYAYVILGNPGPAVVVAAAAAYAVVVAFEARQPGAELERDQLIDAVATRLGS